MTRWPAGVVASLLIVASIAGAQEPPVAPVDPERIDRFTSADPGAARVTHVSLDLRLDFAERRAMGTARLRVQLARGASAIVVDTKDLDIEGVTNLNNQPMPYVLGEVDAVRGRPLVVSLPEPARTPATVTFTIAYRTQPHGAALQWLAPGQTVGGVRPYVYSQGQAILTRSWIPTQDSPGLRQTYDARIVVPEGLRVVMSAESLTPDGEPVEGMTGVRAFRFRMTQSIPPYLIALAAGDIAFKPIGTRTGVFAEPAMLAAAAAEFADVDRMLAAAETIAGPYRWRRYDVLVLPPAFPYGGMENPRLTFVSPSIVAGDRSLVSVVAHEIAHSWAGNLVTNATWRDAWLNEGLATYLERRINEALHGPERARMLEQLGRAELLDELARLGPRSPDSQLHLPDTTGDPDATLSVVAYEKGAAFFRMLEETVGRARFDTYLRGYFQRFVFKTLTTTDFRADLREHLFGNDVSFDTRILLGDWLDAPGLPANIPPIDSEAFRAVDEIADAFAAGATLDELNPTLWSTQEWQRFITRLPAPLARERLEVLDARFRLSQRTNSEVLFAWLQLAARSQHAPATTAIEAFLTSTGRRKFVEPLYQALAASEWGRPIARRIFARARPSYHAVVAASIERLLAR